MVISDNVFIKFYSMLKLTVLRSLPLLYTLLCCCLVSVQATAQPVNNQQFVAGIVCSDLNSNGICDGDEPGIAGVMVSNQHDVVLTDNEGQYRLPVREGEVIFITKPADYKLPLNENNLPQFYYIHQPDGSPDLEFPGIRPTGTLPPSVDFALIPSEKKDSFTAAGLADPTLREHSIPFFRDGVASEVANLDVDFAFVLGDMMADDLSFFPRYNEIMSTLDIPVFNVVGNHDVNFNIEDRFAKETFKRFFGPTYYSFNYGEVHFVVLDNIEMMEDGGSPYRGYVDKTQLAWLRNNLQYVDEEKLIVLLAHIPLHSMDTDSRSNNTVNTSEVLEILEAWEKVLFLCGHRHVIMQQFLNEEHGRINPSHIHHSSITAAAGGWWRGPENIHGIPVSTQNDGSPNGYHVFTFDGNSYTDRFYPSGLSADYQMRIESPSSTLLESEVSETELIVNIFNGTEKSEVEFWINDAEQRYPMQWQPEYQSPFSKTLEWVRPTTTNHIWKAELPDLGSGTHRITVWTRDIYGYEFTQSKIIEIK